MEARSQTAPQAHMLRGSNFLIVSVYRPIRQRNPSSPRSASTTDTERIGGYVRSLLLGLTVGLGFLALAKSDVRRISKGS